MKNLQCDLLGLGSTSVDEMLYAPHYPSADTKVHLDKRVRQCGGLTAIALVAAARFGAKCAYAGVLGQDPDSTFVLQTLRQEGIDIRQVKKRRHARPVRAVIVVDARKGSRTIFYETTGVVGAGHNHPPRSFIQSSKVLFVDRFGMPGMIRAARLARQAGVPVVADFEKTEVPGFETLIQLVDHLIVPWITARQLTGKRSPHRAVSELIKRGHEVAVATCGDQGCWYQHRDHPIPMHQPAFKVQAVDTTGCGDVFHGVYAATLAQGKPLPERIRLASAAAALKATRTGGQAGCPNTREVLRFLK